ncbi:DNA repair and recombination protein RAD54 [Achlya hypogyna]|uniref:DNA repair and recombination protein RAD54 n=1 Tax=Achlya hypogyna TaxID=1202772 RepID=A0A1V9YDV8_ACHHY|nr:DNA repair and recombination protein RAD54 [Achlya hypogyna]
MLRMKPRPMGASGAQFKPPGRPDRSNASADSYESGGMVIKNLPFMSFVNPARDLDALYKAFKSPCENLRTAESDRLLVTKTLGSRRRFGTMPIAPFKKLPEVDVVMDDVPTDAPTAIVEAPKAAEEKLPDPVILWTGTVDDKEVQVIVPMIIGKWLRPHQREGVQFMFDCLSGLRGFEGNGCILADDMGLGKTLQSITIMYTLLCTSMQGPDIPTINRAIVVCPTSLVKNWDDEITKWLQGRVKTVALFESGRENVISGIMSFINGSKWANKSMAAKVLIISYETFRMHAAKFTNEPQACELLICDEAHRLKNANSQINQALNALPCKRRVLLSGTPMQNDLEEFYAMVDFTNPNVLGDPREFRRRFLGPILIGREPDCTQGEREWAQRCSGEMCEIVNQFILRRTNALNAKHLPPKLTQVVCCNLSEVQRNMYSHFLHSNSFHSMMKKNSSRILPSITALKKLCNHPNLIVDNSNGKTTIAPGFEECVHFLPSEDFGARSRSCHPEWSGKFLVLDNLMRQMRKKTTDRIVIVSNYTQTLDVVTALCRERGLPAVRLDGSTSASKRKKLVDVFNDPKTNSFAFLLSSKAGGCGLNLIGANRLVLFDPDWNPATDKQAAARIWREGQKKQCFIYRFVATGTLEEKIFQRQLSKEGLQSIVDDKEEVNSLSSKDLKKLFVFMQETDSDTHDQLKCRRCPALDEDVSELDKKQLTQPQIGMPAEEDLNNWNHHYSYDTVADEIMREAQAGSSLVSFVFSCRVDWDLFQEQEQREREKKAAIDEENLLKAATRKTERTDSDDSDEIEFDHREHAPKRKRLPSHSESDDEIELVNDDDSSDGEVQFVSTLEAVAQPAIPPKAHSQLKKAKTIVSDESSDDGDVAPTSDEDGEDAEDEEVEFIAPTTVGTSLEAHSAPPPPKTSWFDKPVASTSLPVAVESDEGLEEGEIPMWSCLRCTLHNPMTSEWCEGCGMAPPRRAKQSAAASLQLEDY